MAKRVFFSFHYQDVIDFRANVVRNCWLLKKDREDAGFFDASIWESARKTGPLALKRLINDALQNTSVTVVLIGSDTHSRRWVRYEIMRSMYKGNNMLGVHINCIKGKDQRTKPLGPNPFSFLGYKYSDDGKKLYLYEYESDRWVNYGDLESYNLETSAPQTKWGKSFTLSSYYPVYNWVTDNGYDNFSNWVG